ncbi:elongation factor P [Thermodesulfobacteriota bacterium]
MLPTTAFKKGLKIELDGDPYIIVDCNHVKPGKGVAFVKIRIKNLVNKRVIDRTFRSGEKVDKPDLTENDMEFLYVEGEQYHFMDMTNYEQFHINKDDLGDTANYLKEGTPTTVLMHNGKPIGVELPIFVELKIVKTEPGVRGDTVSGATKQAEVESGAVVLVPLFVEQDEVIKIDTRTGEYVERVK